MTSHSNFKRAVARIAVLMATMAFLPNFAEPISGRQLKTPAGVPEASAKNLKEQPAETVFKNIQVLTGQPASQVRDSMEFISGSLSVRCSFCHVKPFASDAKEEKKTARKMIRMQFDINRVNFNGRTRVTCYTCHQGQEKPVSIPRSGELGEMFAAASKIPEVEKAGNSSTVDQVLARYETAMGGARALAHITTRVSNGVETSEGGHTNPVTLEMKTTDAGDIVGRIEQTTERGVYVEGFDGMHVWADRQERHEAPSGFQAMQIVRELDLNPATTLRRQYTQARVIGKVKMGEQPSHEQSGEHEAGVANGKRDPASAASVREFGADAYVLEAAGADGEMERFYFDTKTGLLRRRVTSYETFLGPVPLEADYSDYRAVGSVQAAFTTSWWAGGNSWTVRLDEVKNNVPLDAKRFEAPPSKP